MVQAKRNNDPNVQFALWRFNQSLRTEIAGEKSYQIRSFYINTVRRNNKVYNNNIRTNKLGTYTQQPSERIMRIIS